jgi:hypothetical protein
MHLSLIILESDFGIAILYTSRLSALMCQWNVQAMTCERITAVPMPHRVGITYPLILGIPVYDIFDMGFVLVIIQRHASWFGDV